ncbi:glycosyltransferase family 2 protein [Ectobacillus ponti]|uniref:Glycosyltransferase family 2 protein n=1 Tax=Ectobacillus ponti TaxID=2961894 RepID=A0AA41X8C5_9BACI|nr:glycosyltransferase family 2 protein [Ectobacillus ponti]MCP8970667.1 glycosyltransferase family 2 protein [Ectobacillus ponti]
MDWFIAGIQLYLLFLFLYTAVIGFLGLRPVKQQPQAKPKHRFAVLVAAHNEEQVIGGIVKNLREQSYPAQLYDVYVICDNCSDRTAAVVRENGGIAMERFNQTLRGKGHALEWMFERLWDLEAQGTHYDAVVVFDADNLVSRNFLSVMNTKISEGHEVIQGYLDTKNPHDTWITKASAYAYWTTNRVYQLSRDQLGLSAQLGGTGLVVSTQVLKQIGWRTTSLTEDLEFTQRYILETGRRVAWAHEAKIYDEKPLGLRASMKQRVRWMAGHTDCALRYAVPLFRKAISGSIISFDSLVYLLSPSRNILYLLYLLIIGASLADRYLFNMPLIHSPNEVLLLHPAVHVLVFSLNVILSFTGLMLEQRGRKWFWFFYVILFGLSWVPVTIQGILSRRQRNWSHTQHTRNVSLEDIEAVAGKTA